MDGYQATRQIRVLEKLQPNSPIHQKTAIVALTASAFEEQRASILAAGCDDLVRKPFREQVLFNKMAEHLGVQYIYEEEESKKAGENLKAKSLDLNIMPAEWVAELRQAATRVNAKLVFHLLEQIPEEHNLLAQTLRDLVDSYRFDTIVDLSSQSD